MNTVSRTIKDAYVDIDASQSVVSIEEIFHRAGPVRPVDGMHPTSLGRRVPVDRAPRWVPVVVALSSVVVVAAFVFASLRARTPEPAPPASYTTVSNPSDPDSTDATTIDGGAIGVGVWQAHEGLGAGQVFVLDGVFMRFDEPYARAPGSDEVADRDSYVWASIDATEWSRLDLPLPDVVPYPAKWYFDGRTQTMTATGPVTSDTTEKDRESVTFHASVDRRDGAFALALSPLDSSLDPSKLALDDRLVIPEFEVEGLIPVAEASPATASFDFESTARGDLRVLSGSIVFTLPPDVLERLPVSTTYDECCDAGPLDDRSQRMYDHGALVAEVVSAVLGSTLRVEVLLVGQDGQRTTIHVGEADLHLPRGSVVQSTPFVPLTIRPVDFRDYGFAVEVLWISTDGGTSYRAVQPPMLARYATSWGFPGTVVAQGGRFLWYTEVELDGESGIAVWSTEDGMTWSHVADNLPWFNHSMIRVYDDVLLVPSEYLILRSSDGLEWHTVDGHGGDDLEVSTGGFVLYDSDAAYLSPDGEVWRGIALPPALGRIWEDFDIRFVADVIVIDEFDTGLTWIGRFSAP